MRDFLSNKYILLVLAIGLILRILLNGISSSPDADSFVIWAKYLSENSLHTLYETLPGKYLPYPPTYYYVLEPIGHLLNFVNANNWLSLLLVKIPVFASEIIATWLIFKMTTKWISKKNSIFSSAFFYLNPSLIYVTSVWGQIDAIIIMFSLIFIYLFLIKSYLASITIYLISITVKLQSLAILPLVLALTYLKINFKLLIKFTAILAFVGVLIFMPILSSKGVSWTSKYFFNLPNQYPYTSVYAYNIWSPKGFIESDKDKFLSIVEYRYLGIALFWIISLLIIYPLIRKKTISPNLLIFVALILFFNFYYFSTRIHSRYIIYTLGFIAPFFVKYPKAAISLTVLAMFNLLLPTKDLYFLTSTKILENSFVVLFFTFYGAIFFIWLMTTYKKLLSAKKNK